MIKDNQKVFNRLHLVVDAIVVLISYLLAWYIKFATGFADTEPGAGALSKETYFRFLYFLVPGYIAIYYYFNMYKPKRVTRRKVELINIISANTAGLVCDQAATFLTYYDVPLLWDQHHTYDCLQDDDQKSSAAFQKTWL